MKSSIENYISILKDNFGENLTPQVVNVAEDFLLNYEEFKTNFQQKKIIIITSTNRLADATNDSEYKKHRTYNGISIITFFISVIILFINWKISILIFVISVLLKFISRKVKNQTSNNYNNLLNAKLEKDIDEGILNICVNYCAGIIQLKSDKGFAFLPILPSTCLNGKVAYAKNN